MQKEIAKQEPIHEAVLQNGHAILDSTEPGPERDALEAKLTDSDGRWKELNGTSEKLSNGVGQLYPVSRAYSDDAVTFSVWLMTAESKKDALMEQRLPADRTRLDMKRDELEVIISDLIGYVYQNMGRILWGALVNFK